MGRNNKIIKLLSINEKNYITLRQEVINLLDDKFKPQFIDIQKNSISKTNVFKKNELQSYNIDMEDINTLLDHLDKIVNQLISMSFNLTNRIKLVENYINLGT